MNSVINSQFKILFIFIVFGMFMGLLFDFFRIQRKIFKQRDYITYIQDILFWIISGFIFILVTMKYTNGEIRMYMVAGIILGIILYMRFISKLFVGVNTWILRILWKFINILFSPLKFFYKIIKKKLEKQE